MKLGTIFFLEKKYYATSSREYSFNFFVFLSFFLYLISFKIIFPFSSNFIFFKPQTLLSIAAVLKPIKGKFLTGVHR